MQLVSRSAYTHDAKGRLENIPHANAMDEFLATYDYEWDMADQLLEWTHHGHTANYAMTTPGNLRWQLVRQGSSDNECR